MKQDEKRELKPKLRFLEFRDAPQWEERELGDFTNLIDERVGNKKYTPMSVTTGVGLISQEEKFGREIAGKQYKNYFVIRDGDFAYNKSATKEFPEGFIAMLEGQSAAAVPNSIFICFRVEDEELNRYFLKHIFFANHHGAWLRRFITVGARAHGALNVNSDDLLRMPMRIPSPNEQQKIADCLSSLDELIAAQSQKLETLQAHKKGLLQQLFPAEGETVPRLRFPEFRDAGEWKTTKLGSKVTKVGSGITPKGGDRNYKTNGRIFIRSQNIGWGELLLKDVAYIDDSTHAKFDSTEIKMGDVFLNITGASIGRSAAADSRVYGGNVNQHVCIIRPKTKMLNPNFLNQYLISHYGQKQIDSFQAGGNRQGLNFGQIRSFMIPTPPKLEEQSKVAEFLRSVDELSAAQSQKLDALNALKKGLLQQLFPSPEEMQG